MRWDLMIFTFWLLLQYILFICFIHAGSNNNTPKYLSHAVGRIKDGGIYIWTLTTTHRASCGTFRGDAAETYFAETGTWIEQEEKLDTDVVADVELEVLQFGGEVVEMVRQRRDAQEPQAQQVKLLAVGQRRLVREVVVHTLVHVVQHQHVGPTVLQQLHLIVHLWGDQKGGGY